MSLTNMHMCVLSNACVCVFLFRPGLETLSGDSDKHYCFLVQGGALTGTVNNSGRRKVPTVCGRFFIYIK